jgi:asparagine synthase (glutamine-hydrolysing)
MPPREILPGKTVHAAYLMRAQKSIELYSRAFSPPHVAPLISQPVMELCLSIPTWLWVSGGQNRAVARRAFASELPSLVTTRTSKGGPGGFDMLIYRRNKDRLHERLRHGLLTRNGIFDPALLDVPEDRSWRGVERIQRILEFAAAENWVRWWSGS